MSGAVEGVLVHGVSMKMRIDDRLCDAGTVKLPEIVAHCPRVAVTLARFVNVLLPCAYALGQAASDDRLSARALALYRRYPSGPPNRVVREMAVQVGGADGLKLARGACRQQGLIHLYRHWCDSRDCARCAAQTAPSH